MDERLKNALELSNLIETLNNAKRIAYEKFLENTVFYKNGGRFNANQEIISFCKTLIDSNQDFAVLIDNDGDPVLIENLQEFLKEVLSVYFNASNSYIAEVTKINAQRTVGGVVDL